MHHSKDCVPEKPAGRTAPLSIEGLHLPEPLHAIAEALGQIRYGVIQLTVHDGRLMQLDITERRRFT